MRRAIRAFARTSRRARRPLPAEQPGVGVLPRSEFEVLPWSHPSPGRSCEHDNGIGELPEKGK